MRARTVRRGWARATLVQIALVTAAAGLGRAETAVEFSCATLSPERSRALVRGGAPVAEPTASPVGDELLVKLMVAASRPDPRTAGPALMEIAPAIVRRGTRCCG